jgi:hypothetical protein
MPCKFIALTLNGGKSSSMRRTNSSISPTKKPLKLSEVMTRKELRLVLQMKTKMKETNNGKFFMLTKPIKLRPRD